MRRPGYVNNAVFILPAVLFTLAFLVAPLLGVVYQSFLDPNSGSLTLGGYAEILGSSLFQRVIINTIIITIFATITSLVLAYPLAYYISKQTKRKRSILLVFVLIPFWTSALVKIFAFIIILGNDGLINAMLTAVNAPRLPLLFNKFGIIIGMTHYLIPFMLFPILANLLNQPPMLARAAEIMGAGKIRIFLRVTLPLSYPAVAAGMTLVAIISMGFYIVPALLGGRQDIMISNLIEFYTREVLRWQAAAVIAVLLVLLAGGAAYLLSRLPGNSDLLEGEQGR